MNALYVWGLGRVTGRAVILRIEDHDRQRSRRAWDEAILEDLEWMGFVPDAGPYRQSEEGPVYAAAAEKLRAGGIVYPCDCSRTTFAAWGADHGRPWRGPGCPGGCRARGLTETIGLGLRVALPEAEVTWTDLLGGNQRDSPTREGDLLIRDRAGNWTYPLCVVVDDIRQSVDLVVRGEDLLHATARQIALMRALGHDLSPTYGHHPIVRKPGGAKLSKADGDTSVRDLRAAGLDAASVIGQAALAVGLIDRLQPLGVDDGMALAAATVLDV